MSTPEKHEPDQKTTPQQDQSMPEKQPDQQGDGGEKPVQEMAEASGVAMNLASKSDKKQNWKGIG